MRVRAITLELALGQIVPWQTVADAMKHGFREALNLEFESGELSEAEWRRVRQLREGKYLRVVE